MINQIQEGYVKVETHQGVSTIEFFHPQSNSLPGRMLEELAKEFHSLSTDAETRVILLRSGGDRAFCAGASFDELMNIKTEAEGTKFFSGFAHVINAMRKCSKLIVARIQGKCVGGGVGLAAAADYAIAIETAEIRLSELAIGIGPFVVGPVIEKKIGTGPFAQLAIDAQLWRNAEWAKRKGLFAELHASVENMDEAIQRLTNHLAHSNPAAMAELKKIFWQGTDHWNELLTERAAISGKLINSDFSRNAIRKFKEKK